MIRTKLPITNISVKGKHYNFDCMDGSLPANKVLTLGVPEEGEAVVLVALNAQQVDDLTRLGKMDLFTNSDVLTHMAMRFDYMKQEHLMDHEQSYKGTGTVTVEFEVEVEVQATSRTGAAVAMKMKLEDDWEQFALDSVGGPHVEADIKASLKE
jgi:hypothetical protein|tara:strand:+ start:61 stop:522 length:462 start_codon:yes stop_codon:yes gene_type:complete